MEIWVDCDGVLADFCSAYLRMLGYITGRRHTFAEVTSFEFSECVATKDENEAVWRAIDLSPGFVRGLAVLEGAADGVAALRECGKVRCLTSPHFGPFWMHERTHWLAALGFKKREIVFAADKSLVPGDILIDDRRDALVDWAKAHPGGRGLLFDAPYNRAVAELPINVMRVRGWSELVAEVGYGERERRM